MIKKIVVMYPKGKSSSWADEAATEFQKKISHFVPFELVELKTKAADRESSELKKEAEKDAILKALDKTDTLILFDEKGKQFAGSKAFSEQLQKQIEVGSGRLVFLIGGPYGIDESLKKISRAMISFSALTMSHHVAKVVALEQIYRAFTIQKGIPYHNE